MFVIEQFNVSHLADVLTKQVFQLLPFHIKRNVGYKHSSLYILIIFKKLFQIESAKVSDLEVHVLNQICHQFLHLSVVCGQGVTYIK